MKVLYDYIKLRINTRVPSIKQVEPWNSQFENGNGNRPEGRINRAVRYPCCFIEFIVEESWNRSLGIIDYKMIVRFRFGVESYKYVKLETLDFCDAFAKEMQLMAATKNSTTIIFNTFQEIVSEFDENHDNVDAPAKDYRTVFRSLAAYNRGTLLQATPTEVDITPITLAQSL
jgi:hypothetical protein